MVADSHVAIHVCGDPPRLRDRQAHGVRRGHTLWNRDGQALLASLPLPPHTADRRSEIQALYQHLQAHIARLDDRVEHVANDRARATLLMTHPGVGPSRRWRLTSSSATPLGF